MSFPAEKPNPGAPGGNPIIGGIGLTDPHGFVHQDRLYLFASHDFSAEAKTYIMRDWWVWSSDDLVHWRQECILRPEDTCLRRPFDMCWAGFGVEKNGKWHWYLSVGPKEIGVVVADSPAGPWRDPLGKPLIAEGLTPTLARDPDILLDDDGAAYMVYGTFDYFIVRLGDDMISLAEPPRPVILDRKFGPRGEGKTADQPSLHKYRGRYYLSWSGFYAVSDNVYGPYAYQGSVFSPDSVEREFRNNGLHLDRHGNFFTWKNQWYYAVNDRSQPGSHRHFRAAALCYVHYRADGTIAPVRLDRIGVGRYDARLGRIEAEDYFRAEGAWKHECQEGGFEMRGLETGSQLVYPNVMNLRADTTLEFRVASGHPEGAEIEVHEASAEGALLGRRRVASKDWNTYQDVACPLQNTAGIHSLCLVIKGGPGEAARLNCWSQA
ncbi:MAG: family 43 glycosylhydrolase [Candidatus Sumerlaeota bacterium]|nr:family 43 glycosylhydrolase [Candidatus Sumerlaeota bacterium]